MIFEGPAEQTMLQLRIEELERRLAQLEEQVRPTGHQEAEPAPPALRDGAEILFGRRTTDPQIDVSQGEDSDEGREGVRLVALEMLSAGYRPEQVATYLRETFGVEDVDTVLADAGPVSG